MLTQASVIHDGYRTLERIAQGEIGEVYKAERPATAQLCVIKVLNAGLMSDSRLVERFKEEAKRASTFQHPNAVHIEEIRETEDGRPFVVMAYLTGENLRDAIAREGRLPVARACLITRQAATVLQAAHASGIVHQDVTPDNIMLVETPTGTEVRLLDCFIAQIKEDRRRDMGRITLRSQDQGTLMGTPDYFSPEMAVGKRGSELDGRSDLYSLGVVLYQMLCGELPFEAKSGAMDALLAHLLIPPRPISGLGPDAPEALGRLVMRMLEKNPASRPSSSRIVAEELEKVEWALRQTPSLAPLGASPPEDAETAGAGLPTAASTLTSSPGSPSQPAMAVLDIQSDTAMAEAQVVQPLPAAMPKAPRRWLRWAAGTAITALSLGLAARFLTPIRTKLNPHFKPAGSATSAASPASRLSSGKVTGQTDEPATTTSRQGSGPPATGSSGTTPPVSKASPQPTETKPGTSASQDEGVVGQQVATPGERTSKASQPKPDPARVRAWTAEGDEFFRLGEYDQAIQSYGRALLLDPSSQAVHAKILRARIAKAAEEKYLNE